GNEEGGSMAAGGWEGDTRMGERSRDGQSISKRRVPMNERIADTAVPDDSGGLHEQLLQHLDSAYNLARWLMGNVEDAEDVTQEAYVRALQYSRGFRGGDVRPWLLAIVRNTSYRSLRKRRAYKFDAQFDEERHGTDTDSVNPERLVIQAADAHLLERALGELPVRFREILVLRELEGLSYREISELMAIPMGTVNSMRSRASPRRRHLICDERVTLRGARVDG